MTPTDELIAALRAAAKDRAARDWSVAAAELTPEWEAADRLASLAAPVGEWETTADERRRLTLDADNMARLGQEYAGWPAELFQRVFRDLDRALASLSAERAARKEADRIGAMKAEQYAAERDQNKRLVEALRETRAWIDDVSWSHNFNCDRAFAIIDATLAQPEEQR